MDPNLDLDVISLDKGIADLEATGTSTWDFQTQDCDPLSLAERLKALKERDSTLAKSSSNSASVEPEGECKAARHVAASLLSAWDDVPKNTIYTKADGSYGRLTFNYNPRGGTSNQLYLDIFVSPYNNFFILKADDYVYWDLYEVGATTITVTKLGEENINKPLYFTASIYAERDMYYQCHSALLCVYYPGVGTDVQVRMFPSTSSLYEANFSQGKYLGAAPFMTCERYYYRGKMNPHWDASHDSETAYKELLQWKKDTLTGLCPYSVAYCDLTPFYDASGSYSYWSKPYVPWYMRACKQISQHESAFTTDALHTNEYIGLQALTPRFGLNIMQYVSLGQSFDSKYTNIPEEWNAL